MKVATCPGCGATYDVTGRPVGRRLTCPACRAAIVVPEETESPADVIRHRAVAKLEAARRRTEEPLGPDMRRVRVVALWCGIPALVLLGLAALSARTDPVGAAIRGIVVLGLLAPWPFWVRFRTRPSGELNALLEFYRCLARGDHERAYGLVLFADKDDLPRRQPPETEEIGEPSFDAFRLDDVREFGRYWDEILRARPLPYCRIKLLASRWFFPEPDVAVAEFTMDVTTDSGRHALLYLAGPAGILVSAVWRAVSAESIERVVRRVLVNVGDEWRLLSGDWMGADEEDLTWLVADEPEEAES